VTTPGGWPKLRDIEGAGRLPPPQAIEGDAEAATALDGEGQQWKRTYLLLRVADTLPSEPLSQHHKGVTDLNVGTSNRDVALVTGARRECICWDLSTWNVVDLFETLTSLL
jgi:hypothetical protein